MGEPRREKVLMTLQIKVPPGRMMHYLLGPVRALQGRQVCRCQWYIDHECVLLLGGT